MADDIVTRLREVLAVPNGVDIWTMTALQAADEIERLRAALALAVGELSTHSEYRAWSPEMLMNQFLQEAEGA